jgi:hypothetical protein
MLALEKVYESGHSNKNSDLALATYVIPLRQIDTVASEIFSRLVVSHASDIDHYRFILVVGDVRAEFVSGDIAKYADVFRMDLSQGPFHKLASVGLASIIRSHVVHFVTGDDVWRFSTDDTRRFLLSKAMVSQGNMLCARPIDGGAFRIFRGRTLFREFMDREVSENRLWTYIDQGPETVYATFDARYFQSLAGLVADLIAILESEGNIILIEDVISVANLCCSSRYSAGSNCLRFVDVNYGVRSSHKFSWQVVQEISNNGLLDLVVEAVQNHLVRVRSFSDHPVLDFSSTEIGRAIALFSHGYRTAALRKWRDWLDVEFHPFQDHGTGICPNANSPNKYDVVFRWYRGFDLKGVFPTQAWLGDFAQRELVLDVPLLCWQQKAVFARVN